MRTITDYYEAYDEDSRLKSDQSHKIEFITTTSIVNEYLNENDSILEVGAGAGIYSFYYADRGHQVTATDLTPKHIEMIQSKLKMKPALRMNAQVADATNLSDFEDGKFDIVLCLGPMYHLTTLEAQKECISECLRVLKPGGMLAVAYVTRFSVFPYLVKGDRGFLTENWIDRILDKGFITSDEKDCFWTDAYFHSPDEIVELMKLYNTEMIEHLATDGVGPLMSHIINELSPEEFDVWIKYHLRTCTEPSTIGNSNHGLYMCRKN